MAEAEAGPPAAVENPWAGLIVSGPGQVFKVDTGRTDKPGAVSLTWLTVRTPEEGVRFSQYTQEKVVPALARLPGFLSFTGGGIGAWQFTLTMWASMEAVGEMQGLQSHREAVKWFFRPGPDGIASAGLTGVWGVERLNTLWVRCTGCDNMVDADAPGALCTVCGVHLPDHTPYW